MNSILISSTLFAALVAAVQIGRKVRHLSELSLAESVSTRLLVSAGRLIHAGVPPRLACVSAIAEPITDDADARAAIRQVIELSI